MTEFSIQSLVGKTKAEAEELAKANGLQTRISQEDEETFMLTSDYWTDRVTFRIVKGMIVEALLG